MGRHRKPGLALRAFARTAVRLGLARPALAVAAVLALAFS